ncbi:MAG: hypothetical protein LBC18_03300 [Opitutaceae bacterium]|nr:hypothetical protein [Opitutaceae bacterium]
MNLTLGTLSTLKAWLLNPDLLGKTAYDSAIAELGRGTAARFELFCNRQFARATRTRVVDASLCQLSLAAFPVESAPEVEACYETGGGFTAAPGDLAKFAAASGVVWLAPTDALQRRLTWTGGYWLDESADGTGALPAGAAPVPDALRLAWLQQCARDWARRQKLGIPPAATQSAAEAAAAFLPEVAETLAAFKRHAL